MPAAPNRLGGPTDWTSAFVEDRTHSSPRPPLDFPAALDLMALYLQNQDHDCFKVALANAPHDILRLGPSDLRDVAAKGWQSRAGRASHAEILVVGPPSDIGDRVFVFGPQSESPLRNLKRERIRTLASLALSERSLHDAQRVLKNWLPGLDESPGVLNRRLFDDQRFKDFARNFNVPQNGPQLPTLIAGQESTIFEHLGHRVEQHEKAAMLHAGAEAVAAAVFLEPGEVIGLRSGRLGGQAPLLYALSVAKETGTPWVVVVRSPEFWLYPVSGEAGIGGGGREDTAAAINLSLLDADSSKFAHMLFSADALRPGGHLDELLDSSRAFVVELGNGLRERIYDETVPLLASAISQRLPSNSQEITDPDLDDAFEQVMLILFRILFVAYSEHKGLLPLDDNHHYHQNSLSLIAKDIINHHGSGEPYGTDSTDLWDRVSLLWGAVSEGNPEWGVPAYNGGLFSADSRVSPAGWRLASTSKLTDAEFGPALEAALTARRSDKSSQDDPTDISIVDFGSLSVREFGTIYEGLLESRLVVAPIDLAHDRTNDSYSPASDSSQIAVAQGSVYLHHRSGIRKSTGSYFTKPFAVKHLLDHALKPALDDHIARLDRLNKAGDDQATADAFLDFRCADIAMGSGHFLVAAIDRIEECLSDWLSQHPLPGVLDRLASLRTAAQRALRDDIDIPTGSLLRRQIARHCIYGVDCNQVAVDLARLAVWVHTFVPGLPLSFLDHNLVHGDSLTGIASIEAADDALREKYPETIRLWQVSDQIAAAYSDVTRLSNASDESVDGVAEARRAHEDASQAVAVARAVFDLISAERAGVSAWPTDPDDLEAAVATTEAAAIISDLRPLHFPAAFPEVFARERPGFDCILGNPPFQEATVEELGFWALRFPGLKSKRPKQRDEAIAQHRIQRPDLYFEYETAVAKAKRLRHLLIAGPYPGMGEADPDLYKAFCWRFWHLAREGGHIGVVLPREALSAKGSTKWRTAVLTGGTFDDVTMLVNNRGWVFDDVEYRYTFALCSIRKGPDTDTISMSGPFGSEATYKKRGSGIEVETSEFRSWSKTAAFPMVPSPEALSLFRKFQEHPRLDTRSSPKHLALPVAELHATNDKSLFMNDNGKAALEGQEGCWPVYGGRGFNIWQPDTGNYFSSASASQITNHLYKKRLNQHNTRRSPFHKSRFSEAFVHNEDTLSCRFPRIAFRDVARATDSRTVIAALVPRDIVIANQAPYLVWPHGSERDEAFLLGVFCSMILDWYARRIVEKHLSFYILNGLPIPDVNIDTDPVARRVVEVSGRLAAVDDRYVDWADAVGVPVGSALKDTTKNDLIHELDACVARLYGLDRDDIGVIYETFHKNADYSERKTAVLRHFERLP